MVLSSRAIVAKGAPTPRYSWVVWEGQKDLELGTIARRTHSPNLVLLPDRLTAGKTYTFRVYATDQHGRSDHASAVVRVNAAPTNPFPQSDFTVAPASGGRALSTSFKLSCGWNWADDDQPLAYSFSVGAAALTTPSPSETAHSRLPQGGANGKTVVVCMVQDVLGSSTSVSTSVEVATMVTEGGKKDADIAKEVRHLNCIRVARIKFTSQ